MNEQKVERQLTESQKKRVEEIKSYLIDKLWEMKDLRHHLPYDAKRKPLWDFGKIDLYNAFGALRYKFNKCYNESLSIDYFPIEFLDRAVGIQFEIGRDFKRRYEEDIEWVA